MSDWYCKLRGNIAGPFSVDEVRFLKSRGKLAPDDEVRQGDAGDWVLAESVGLFSGGAVASLASLASGRGAAVPTITPRDAASSSPELLEGSSGPGVEDAEIPQQLESAALNAPPPYPDQPQEMGTQERVMIGVCIGAGVALLILLLVLFLFRPAGIGGSKGSVAGRGVGDGGGDGIGEGVGVGDGTNEGDSSSNADSEDPAPAGPQSEIETDDKITEEPGTGEATDAPASPNPPEDIPPPEEEMPLSNLFTISERSGTDDAPTNEPGESGGGAGMGEFGERLDREGAKSGAVQISLLWNNLNDLDLHILCPSGEMISYQKPRSRCGGELDVDMNAGGRKSNVPVENVYWPEDGAAKGKFIVMVNHFANHGGGDPTKFTVAVTVDGQTKRFSGQVSSGQPKRTVHSFTRR